MFGFKIIKREEYDSFIAKYKTLVQDYKIAIDSLEELAQQISRQTESCKMGPWCKGCKHSKYVYTQAPFVYDSNYLISKRDDRNRYNIEYCGKHITEICPEWEE